MDKNMKIGGAQLRDMIIAGAALLERNKASIDALNVFPVPDGDTGTNMSMTCDAQAAGSLHEDHDGWPSRLEQHRPCA